MAPSDIPSPEAPASLPVAARWRWALYTLAIFAAVFAAYYPSLHGAFVWDDQLLYDQLKPLFQDASGLARMWKDPSALYQYYPLTGTTFWLDRHFWGEWTLPYHVENVLLHACAALLFCRVLQRLSVPGSWLAGALFAFHPMMAESVAFITERRNVLSMVFFLTALLAYGRFAAFWPQQGTPRRWAAWWLALLLFAGALLAKVTAYAFPPAMLLLVWWKRGRIRWKADVLPLLPFFALAFALGLCAMWMEVHRVGAQGAEWDLTVPQRFLVAGRALWFYALKFVWPAGVCLVYPRWQVDAGAWWQWLFPLGFALLVITLWVSRKRLGRGPLTALFFYGGTLLPVLGFVNVYGMLYSFVADRWIYVPSLSLCAVIGALVVRAAGSLRRPLLSRLFGAAVLPCLLVLTWQQSGTWANPYALWHATLQNNPVCWMAHVNLCYAYVQDKDLDSAIQEGWKALELNPKSASVQNNLGQLFTLTGKLDEAEVHLQAALSLNPGDSRIYVNYAALRKKQGRNGEALIYTYFPQVLQPQEKNWGQMVDLAWLLAASPEPAMRSGKMAVGLAERANILSKQGNPQVLQTLAAAYAEAGRFEEAVTTAARALTLAGKGPMGGELRGQLKLYQANMPFHAATQALPNLPAGSMVNPGSAGVR